MIGNFAFEARNVGLILCVVIVFIAQFTLYFTMSVSAPQGNKRVLVVFFMHYIYLSGLIILLRGEEHRLFRMLLI